jgi:hypothetical protein
MDWVAIAAVVSIIISLLHAAYSYGVTRERLNSQKEELVYLRDRLNRFMEYWKTQ